MENTNTDLELTEGEELYIAYLKGEYNPPFRSIPTRSYDCHPEHGCGYHEDNSPEERNPTLHKGY